MYTVLMYVIYGAFMFMLGYVAGWNAHGIR